MKGGEFFCEKLTRGYSNVVIKNKTGLEQLVKDEGFSNNLVT